MSKEIPNHTPTGISSTAQRRHFRIKLRGLVDQGWIAAFDPLTFSSADGITLFEVLADQAALRGILNRLWSLNLDILLVAEVNGPAV